jgi:hypothetical protein
MTCAYLACALTLAAWRGWLDGIQPRRAKPQLRLIIGGKAA